MSEQNNNKRAGELGGAPKAVKSKASAPSSPAASQRRPKLYYGVLAALVLAAGIAIIQWGRPGPPREAPAQGRKDPGEVATTAPGASAKSHWGDDEGRRPKQAGEPPEIASNEGPSARERREKRVRQTLDGYRAWAKYPPNARPISEQPDLVRPHSVSPNKLPLAREDKKLTDATVTLEQDRYFVVGDEEVTFTIACATSDGPAPCEVLSSIAGVPFHARDLDPSPPPDGGRRQTPVPFGDTGKDADRKAGDGVFTATLKPIAQGFEGYHGPIRLEIELRVEGESGRTSFDIEYTPEVPAVFTGKVRDVLEDGSLSLYVAMDIGKPGRYVVSARVDDADGRSFAFLTFNEELGAGRQEAKLVLFGKLVRDEKAKSPFRLRDVEGFLLKPDTYPDRELMPLLEGTAHTTKRYAQADFSESEWESEEKDRHLNEYQKNVDELSSEPTR